ncbi:hypothetical protein N7494_001830 [Penicillium frequentans]|uniref:Uncharacterized protein n=1 Tax=Penicillium frequentans TaxID=3151616 RepID=A0AAD6D2G2_9EURO|nr:hypothetical protein N7494_001830 [Penicillium glabrum]
MDDETNQALESAFSSFEQNPVYSSANAEFASAMNSFPASVTSSLSCSGYSGININSLPTWLASVPTAVVSVVLKEQQVYQSIIGSFEAEATMTSSATIASQSTTPYSSSQITTSEVSASISSTSPATSSSSSAAVLGISETLSNSLLAAVSLVLTGILL